MESVSLVKTDANEKALLEKELSQLMEVTLRMENELGSIIFERES